MAKKSTSESPVDTAAEKPAPAEVAAKPVDEPKATTSVEAEPKAAADPVVAKTADAPADSGPSVSSVEAVAPSEGPAAPAEKSTARKEIPGLSAIPVPASLMAAAIANRRRLAKWLNSRAAMLAIAAGIGAIVGSVISTGLGQAIAVATNQGASQEALQATIGQLTAEVATLRSRIDGKPSATVLSGTPQLLGEPEMADAGGVSNEITGSIAPSREVAEGWILWRVRNGRALVQGSSGYFEVAPGSRLPKLGTVEAITRQGGSWSVETEGGLILPGS